MFLKALSFVGILAVANAVVSYENYKVYNVVPKSEADVQILTDLKKGNYEFWTEVLKVGSEVRIMVSPKEDEGFVKYIKSVGIEAAVSIANVQDLIDAQTKILNTNSTQRSTTFGSFSWDTYHNLDHIYSWLDELESMYPDIVTVINIAPTNTFENRPIKAVVIDFKPDERGENPLIGMIEGGIHATEWISPATVTWIIKEFLTSTDSDVRFMAETFVWHIIPVTNPDGYAYTFTEDRLWRKNRNTANNVLCDVDEDHFGNGIDLNRNFNFLWMTIGASDDPCHPFYAGPSPSSEIEVQSVANYVTSVQLTGELIYYFAFHSYSQMVMLPYSHLSGADVLEVSNYADLYEIAVRGAQKLEARHGTHYQVGTSREILYAVSGSSFDWVKGVLNVPIALLFELRDTGSFGFLLPADQIIPNNEEIMDALVEMNWVTRQLGYYTASGSSGTVFSSIMSLVVAMGMLVLL